MKRAVATCFRRYATFSGRAPRSEFWYFILFLFVGLAILTLVNSALFGPEVSEVRSVDAQGRLIVSGIHHSYTSGLMGDIFLLGTFVPWLAVGWRRMHDSGRPGYLPWLPWLAWTIVMFGFIGSQIGFAEMIETLRTTGQVQIQSPGFTLFMLVAFVGCIILNIYWLALASAPGPNKYGPNPITDPEGVGVREVFQ